MAHLLVGRYLLANEPLFLPITPTNNSSGKLPPPTGAVMIADAVM